MWHEARKQEKKIRGMLVDYRKRADRRKEFYEKIKADPNRFLQVHGRKCKIHYEVTDMTDDMHMMAWQGQKDNLIDRFDVRAHLDYIPPQPKKTEEDQSQPQEKVSEQERQLHYESYRVLAQNDFLGINETDFLRQIHIEEQFGSSEKSIDSDKNKKKNSQLNAAIGYTYEDSGSTQSNTVPFAQQILSIETSTTSNRYEECAKDCSDESENDDIDVSVDVKKVGQQQAHDLNNFGKKYGMVSNDLFSFLTRDEDEKLSLKAMKEQEADKMLGGGRKSRRERRSQREKRIGKPFTLSPPSYAAKEEKVQGKDDEDDEESEKSSRDSKSPSVEKITYITSFGGEEELQPHAKISIPFGKTMPKNLVNLRRNESFAEMVKDNSDKLQHMNEVERRKYGSRRRSNSRRRHYRSRSRSRRRRYSSRSRSQSRGRRRNYRRSSRSTSYSSRERRRRRYSRRRSGSYRRRSSSRSRSRDRTSYNKSRSQRKSVSREKSRRAYSSSSSSSSSSSTTSSSSGARSNTSSPEKKPIQAKKSVSKEKSRSKTVEKEIVKAKSLSVEKAVISPPPPATVKRYYGRKRDDDSSSSLSVDSADDDDDDDKKHIGSNDSSANEVTKNRSEIKIGVSKSTVGAPSHSNPREKLKKKMQILLNKQYRADKKAETEKIERQMQQQQERDEEMREMAIRLRRRQRELRHKYGGENQDSRTNSDSEDGGDKRRKKRSSSSSSTSSSEDDKDDVKQRRKSRSNSRQRKRVKTSISRSPVRYERRRSRSKSKSSGRNYRRRFSRSRSRDYRR